MSSPAPQLQAAEEPKPNSAAATSDPSKPEDLELKWLREVYQGDNMPQFTPRAVIMGMMLGSLMACSNLYTGLKTGWSLGVAITSCIMSWTIFKALRGVLGSEPSILENNCMQSTASAAGASTGTTLVSAFSAYLMITGHHLPMGITMALVFFLAMMGVFMAIPMKRNMINVERLPFPSGTAAAETLRSLYSAGGEAMLKAKSLFYAMGAGAVIAFWRDGLQDFAERFKWKWAEVIALPNFLPIDKLLRKMGFDNAATVFDPKGYCFSPEISFIMLSAGALMGIRVGLSMLAGAILAYGVLAPIMHHTVWGIPDHPYVISVLGYRAIVSWTVWGGVSMMTTAALLNFGLQWRMVARAFSGITSAFKPKNANAPVDPLERVEVPAIWFLIGTGVAGIGCIVTMYLAFQVSVLMGVIAVLLSFVLAIVACRATGETDTTPIGPLGKITQLTYGILIPQNMTANLMTANITSSVASSSADLLTDLKSGYLLGANPRRQFWAQFSGVFMGTLVAVPAFYMLVPRADILGGDKFPAPAAQVWKAVAEILAKGTSELHPSVKIAIVIGGLVGIGITLLEKAFPKHKHLIPSATGLGLAFTIPCWSALNMGFGAIIAWAWSKKNAERAERYTTPLASGFIAGESLMGVAITFFGIAHDFITKKG
jgi:OPT family oligopeptide transporter